MSEIDRPEWCPDPEGCDPIECGYDRMCGGVLRQTIRHDDLFDNLSFCLEDQDQERINARDVHYIKRLMEKLDAYNTAHQGYVPPGRGEEWDQERAPADLPPR